jgi:hypothetical protein
LKRGLAAVALFAGLQGCALEPPSVSTPQWPEGPVTSAESQLARDLREHVKARFGVERHAGKAGVKALDAAANYLEREVDRIGLRRASLPIQLTAGEAATKVVNIEATLGGRNPQCRPIVVGAHYDSARQAGGANDNGTGSAALIELARWASGRSFARTIRFVFFANEEPPYFSEAGTSYMGSSQYVSEIPEPKWPAAMISLETLGYYTDEPDTQCFMARGMFSGSGTPLSEPTPSGATRVQCAIPGRVFGSGFSRGDFVAFVSSWGNAGVVRRAREAFDAAAPRVKAASIVLPPIPGILWSDHAPFVAREIPAFMVTDTAPMRYPYYHTPEDTVDKISERSWVAAARVVLGLRAVIQQFADDDIGCGAAPSAPRVPPPAGAR